MTYRYAGTKLTGIKELKNRHVGTPAVILGSGTTLRDFFDYGIPSDWPIVAINEAVAYGGRVDYWVLSDDPIVCEYVSKCPQIATILAMHQATTTIHAAAGVQEIYTVNSMAEVKDYDNGYEFFSRGTVMIGGIEMMRWMGVKKFFCFGLDCYRTRDAYYYDGRRPPSCTESRLLDKERLIATDVIWVTSKLRRMIEKLDEAKASGLWDKIELFCVGSPDSQQQAILKIDDQEFVNHKIRYDESKRRANRRKRAKRDEAEGDSQSEPLEGEGNGEGPRSTTLGSGGSSNDIGTISGTRPYFLRDRDSLGGNYGGDGGCVDVCDQEV